MEGVQDAKEDLVKTLYGVLFGAKRKEQILLSENDKRKTILFLPPDDILEHIEESFIIPSVYDFFHFLLEIREDFFRFLDTDTCDDSLP